MEKNTEQSKVLVVNNELVVYSDWIKTDKYLISPKQINIYEDDLDVSYILLEGILYYFKENAAIPLDKCFINENKILMANKTDLIEYIVNGNYSFHTILNITEKQLQSN
jgi:hypothetical protein